MIIAARPCPAARRRLGLALALLGSLLALGLAAPHASAATGGLSPLPSPGGCVSDTGSGGACGHGMALNGADGVAVSPDGRDVYAVAGAAGAVDAFTRQPATGALAQLGGCVSDTGSGGRCANGVGLAGARGVAVSPNGRNVYVAAPGADAVAALVRDRGTGGLTQLAGTAGCVSETGGAGCGDGRGLEGARAVAVSRDGRNVYVGAAGAVAVFARDARTGALSQLAGTAGCLSQTAIAGCADGRALGAGSIAVAPDGRTVYTTSSAGDAVAVLARNPAGGALSQPAGAAGCVSATGTGGQCAVGRALDGASAVTVRDDGRVAYVTAAGADAVAVLARDPASGALSQPVGAAGCVSATGTGGQCAIGRALDGASAVAVTRDGGFVYVAAPGASAVTVFATAPANGALLPLPGPDGCVSDTGSGGQCRDGVALGGASALALSPDARHLYVAATAADAVTGLARITAAPPAGQASGDFDGDGRLDLAIGAPGEGIGRAARTGAVDVVYGSRTGFRTGRDQLWHQGSRRVPGSNETNDGFGAAVAAGDVNGDGFDDLVVGTPGENIGGAVDAGSVTVLYGSPRGLSASGSRLFARGGGGLGDAPGDGDELGRALAIGDLDGDHRADVVIGAPGERVGGHAAAGAVHVLGGAAGGLGTVPAQRITQDTPGVPGAAEGGDRLGDAVTLADVNGDGKADLAAGAPAEDIGRRRDAGIVQVLYGSPDGASAIGSQAFSQDTPGVRGAAEAGDAFGRRLGAGDLSGDGRAELVVGVPGEDVGRRVDAGQVQTLAGSPAGLTPVGGAVVNQNTPGIPGASESGDRLGDAVAVGDVNGDGRDDLAAGAPGESLGRARGAGLVHVLLGVPGGLALAGSQTWTQNSPGIPGRAETGDAFGAVLGTTDADGDGYTDLAVGAPGERLGAAREAGIVHVLYGTPAGLGAARTQLLEQGVGGLTGRAERGDRFGDSASLGGR